MGSIMFEFVYILLIIFLEVMLAVAYKHRERRTLITITIAQIVSYVVCVLFSILMKVLGVNELIQSVYHSTITNTICTTIIKIISILPILILAIIIEGLIYRKYAPAIPHPFYFSLAANVLSHTFTNAFFYFFLY